MEARQPSHGHLSDSDRESPELPRKAEHSMMRLRRASPPAAAPSLRAAQLNRPAVSQQGGSQCTTPGRASRLEVPASDQTRRRPGCSEPCRRLPSQSPHEYERRIQPTDANDTGLHVPQSCGRSGFALYNNERPHQALNMQRPAERYVPSTRPYRGLPELDYPFHDRTATVTTCGRICFDRRKINLSVVFAGQSVGIKQVSDEIWLVSFMDYDLGYFDQETCRLEPIENPFGPKVLPMSPE